MGMISSRTVNAIAIAMKPLMTMINLFWIILIVITMMRVTMECIKPFMIKNLFDLIDHCSQHGIDYENIETDDDSLERPVVQLELTQLKEEEATSNDTNGVMDDDIVDDDTKAYEREDTDRIPTNSPPRESCAFASSVGSSIVRQRSFETTSSMKSNGSGYMINDYIRTI